jgi:hypothetical protein
MSSKLSGPRIKANLSEVLERHVKSYSIAAAAAGVSLLALTQPADAEVIVTQRPIKIGSTPVPIDINHDGIPDFQFQVTSVSYYHVGFFVTATVRALAGGEVVGEPGGFRGNSYASALEQGAEIGPSVHFSSKGGVTIERWVQGFCGCSSPHSGFYGNWTDVSNRYLGVKFMIDGETHFGWVRLAVSTPRWVVARIVAYAYETTPNKPILAILPPENPTTDSETRQTGRTLSPPFLGMLALGSNGLALWRREETLAFWQSA